MSKEAAISIPVGDYGYLETRKSGNEIYWYLRFYWVAEKRSLYRSLKLPFELGRASQKGAMKAAQKKYRELEAKVKIGMAPTATTNITVITNEYFKVISKLAEENDALVEKNKLPKWEVKGGKGFYSAVKCKEINSLIPYLLAYWETLPTEDMGAITFNQLEAFDNWMNGRYELSPSRRAKCITQIRMIWRYGREKEYVNWLPNPSRPAQQIKERARRNLQEEEWDLMRAWAANQVNELRVDKYARKEQKDIALQFYYWFQVISWTGIRPPNGSVKKNLLQWSSYKQLKRKGETEKRLFERDEKDHRYVATIHSQGWRYFDALEQFHKKRGTYREKGYLFCHTHSKDGSYSVGDPILNFYKMWDKMLEQLGLDSPKGTMQNAKLVPYALRGYYITMRLRHGKVNIDKLAMACGTSAKIILQTYYDFSSEKEYDELTKGFELQEDSPSVELDDEGFLIYNELDEAMM